MSAEHPGQSGLPSKPIGRAGDETFRSRLAPRSDLTYQAFHDLNLLDVDLHQSLLTGSLFRGNEWNNVTLSRSDLDGIRAEQSTFVQCDFGTCDIRSSHFVRCRFSLCSFDDSFIDDCDFFECEFDRCGFSSASLTKCRFQDSILQACNLSPGTFLHNRLYRCAR
jgi:uncharacterized protein YjbI with pentapeptide repeats